MAAIPAEKLKVPGESTTNPSFASPQIQTAADVRQSQQVTGGTPVPGNASPTVSSVPKVVGSSEQPQSGGQVPKPPAGASPTTSSIPAGGGATTPTVPTTTGPPPGVPLTTPGTPPPTVALMPTMQSIQGHNAAEDDFTQAKNENSQKLYDAAMAYNGGPVSDLATAQRTAETGLKNATNQRGAAGTIESSLFGEDKSHLATAQAVDDQTAYIKYQQAVTAASDAMNKAQIAFSRATNQEKKEIAEAAQKRNDAITTAGQAPVNPGGSRISTGSALPGGVRPYEEITKGGGMVRVGGRR